MKVLALVTDAYGGYGGIAQYNRDFLEAVASLPEVTEIEVLARLAQDEPGVMPNKVRQHPVVFNRLGYALKATALCIARRPDIIFNGHVYHGPLSAKLAGFTGAALISQLHGTEIWEPLAEALLKPLQKSCMVLCVSEDTRIKYHGQLSSSAPANGVVLHNTFDPRYSPGDRRKARAVFGLANEFVLLSVARLDGRDGYKGHERVMNVLPELLRTEPRTIYLIAGVGADQHRLEQVARNIGVADAVRFMGKVSYELLPDLYRAADLFALPSTGEGFGIAFLEAMASGTPAIGLAVGGAPDALWHHELGLAVEPSEFDKQFLHLSMGVRALSAAQRTALSVGTQERFGRAGFAERVRQVLSPAIDNRSVISPAHPNRAIRKLPRSPTVRAAQRSGSEE